jgi:hypothetical protein
MQELDTLLASLRERASDLAKAQPAPVVNVTPEPAVAPVVAPAAPVAAPEPAAPTAVEPVVAATEPVAEPTAEPAAEQAQADEADLDGEPTFDLDGFDADEFDVTDADGNVVKAINGFAMMKALHGQIVTLRAEVVALKEAAPAEAMAKSFTDGTAAQAAMTESLAKSLTSALDAVEQSRGMLAAQAERIAAQEQRIAAQDALVKSLSVAVEKYGATGTGRVSAVTVLERPSTVTTVAKGLSVGEIFAKAESLNKSGAISGSDVGRIVAYANGGHGLPPELAHHFA